MTEPQTPYPPPQYPQAPSAPYPPPVGHPYPPPHPYQHQVQVTQPVTDKSKRFLNLSTGALVAVITGILLVCCVGPIALCLFSPVLSAFMNVGDKPPTVTVTGCEIGTGTVSTARVRYTIKNNSQDSESFFVKVEIRNSAGARVGSSSDYVSSLGPGSTANEEALVVLDSAGGATCHIVEVT